MPRMLSSLFVCFSLLFVAAQVAHAEPADVTAADRAAMQDVIQQQMDAFRRDDGQTAFSFASPDIRRMFQTPEVFMSMVRQGYAPVYRPREVEFREVIERDGKIVQRVYVVGPDGVPVIALYIMERQSNGIWKIGGCTLLKSDDVTA